MNVCTVMTDWRETVDAIYQFAANAQEILANRDLYGGLSVQDEIFLENARNTCNRIIELIENGE